MEFGIGIPTCREGVFYPMPFAGPQDIVKLTRLAERLGFFSAWGTDFINPVPPMGFPEGAKPNWYEIIVTLSYLAAATERIKLASGVALLPYRDPVILAKQAATLDQFSGGRFLFGWGLGQYREEFVSINAKNRKTHRGRLMEETMEALHLLLNRDGKISFGGEYIEFNDVELHPKTVQKPMPVYIGGHSQDLAKRVAKWATGVSFSITGMHERVDERLEAMKPDLEKEGQDIDELDVVISTYLRLGSSREQAIKSFSETYIGQRLLKRANFNLDSFTSKSLFGTPDEVSEKIQSLGQEGMKHCVLTNVGVDTFGEMLEQVQMFGEEVLPEFK